MVRPGYVRDMNDSSENLLPVASETEAELAAQEAQDDDGPVPLRREAARSGLLPAERVEGTDEAER